MRRLLVLIVVWLALAPAPAAAESPKRIAVLVGNWDYDLDEAFTNPTKPEFVSDLRNPCRDVALVKAELKKADFTIHDYCNVKQGQFAGEIDKITGDLANLPKGSVIFVYYSGHGMQSGGRNFLIPVMFKWNADQVNGLSDAKQLEFFRAQANEVGALFRKLPDDPDVALIVALDNCRDNPVDQKTVYNEAVSMRTPPNAVVLYATTAGDTTSDRGGGDNSDFARELADQLSKGKDLGDILSQVNVRLWERFRADKRDTYAELDAGAAFTAMRSVPLRVDTPAATGPVSSTLPRKKEIVRNVYDGTSLDILWCEGPGEAERYAYARKPAEGVKSKARALQVGRIQLKPLSQQINDHGNYGVYRNLMRYDDSQPKEREVLMNVAQAFPDANFLLRRGVGVGGRPTLNYVSAFICGRVEP